MSYPTCPNISDEQIIEAWRELQMKERVKKESCINIRCINTTCLLLLVFHLPDFILQIFPSSQPSLIFSSTKLPLGLS